MNITYVQEKKKEGGMLIYAHNNEGIKSTPLTVKDPNDPTLMKHAYELLEKNLIKTVEALQTVTRNGVTYTKEMTDKGLAVTGIDTDGRTNTIVLTDDVTKSLLEKTYDLIKVQLR